MARNTLLTTALVMLKAELGTSLVTGVAIAADAQLYMLLDQKQKWLASEFDWPFLRNRSDIAVPGTSNAARYQNIPTDINFERPVIVETFYNNYWYPVTYGINSEQYNTLRSGDAGTSPQPINPIRRWDWKPGDHTMLEVWPLPTIAQTLRFQGEKPLTTLINVVTPVVNATLDLDDLMVVLFVAADLLALQKKENAQLKLAQATQRMNRIRASYSTPSAPVKLGSGSDFDRPLRRVVPIVVVG